MNADRTAAGNALSRSVTARCRREALRRSACPYMVLTWFVVVHTWSVRGPQSVQPPHQASQGPLRKHWAQLVWEAI